MKAFAFVFRTWCNMKRTGTDSLDSWIAAFWCSFVGMVLFGMVRLSGMLFVASMEEFDVDRQKASFPYVLCDVTEALIGPITGYYASKLGTRPVLIIGSLLAAVGIGCNFLATSIGTVTTLWGVVFGPITGYYASKLGTRPVLIIGSLLAAVGIGCNFLATSIGTVTTLWGVVFGPITGYYASKLGTRPVLIIGSLLAAVGIGCNFLATSIGTVTTLWGVVFGPITGYYASKLGTRPVLIIGSLLAAVGIGCNFLATSIGTVTTLWGVVFGPITGYYASKLGTRPVLIIGSLLAAVGIGCNFLATSIGTVTTLWGVVFGPITGYYASKLGTRPVLIIGSLLAAVGIGCNFLATSIGTVTTLWGVVFGPITGYYASKLGTRPVLIIGSLLAAVGIGCNFLATSIGTVTTLWGVVFGPITGYYASKLGTRPVLIIGSLLAAVGIGCNFLATSIGTVTTLWGVVFGPITGYYASKLGTRPVLIIGSLLAAVGIGCNFLATSIGTVTTLWGVVFGPITGYYASKLGTRPVLIIGSLLAAVGIGCNFLATSIGTVTTLWGVVFGPITGYYASKLGTRPVLIIGSLLAAVGIGCNFLATSIGTVTTLWGVVFGAGFGFCSPVLPIIITQHFVNKRATASGFMYFGSYLGISVLPAIFEYLVKNYGLKGTFLWLSGMVLHCVPVSMLLRSPDINKLSVATGTADVNQISNPLYATEKCFTGKVSLGEHTGKIIVSGNNETRKISEHVNNTDTGSLAINDRNNEDTSNNRGSIAYKGTEKMTYKKSNATSNSVVSASSDIREIPNCKNQPQIGHDTFPITNCVVKNSKFTQSSCKITFPDYRNKDCHLTDKDPEMCPPKGRRLSEHKMKPSAAFKVFFEPIYILVLLIRGVYACSFIIFMTIIVDFVEDIGLLFTDGKYIILGFSIASNVGLLSFGWVTDCGYLSVTNFLGIIYFARGVTLMAMPYSNGFSIFLSIVMLQGLFEASVVNLLPLIIADNYSEDVREVAISCSSILCGPLYLVTPTLISYFRNGLGSYNYMFYSMSAASVACSVLLFMAPLLAKCRCVKDESILRNRNIPESAIMA